MPKLAPLRDIAPKDIRAQATADGHVLFVTDDLVRVVEDGRIRLDVPIGDVRRIQFDIERERPATLVIVPDSPTHDAQVISVPPENYAEVSLALAILGLQMTKYKN